MTVSEGSASKLPGDQTFYLEYEGARRLRLTRMMAITFMVLLGFAFVITPIFFSSDPSIARAYTGFVLGEIAIAEVLYGLVIWLTHKRYINVASGTLVITTLALIVSFQASWAATRGIDVLILGVSATYFTIIALTGLIASRRFLYIVLGLASLAIITIGLLVPWPRGQIDLHSGLGLEAITAFLLGQVAATALMRAASGTYTRTLRELGEALIAYEQVRQLDELKDQFISNVNHELRNPIMALVNYVDLLDRTGAGLAETQYRQLTGGAMRVSNRVLSLLNTILDARRLEQGATDFTSTRIVVKSAIEDAAHLINSLEGSMAERELRLQVPDDLAIWGEAVRLQQILTNLFSNAIKYSHPGTPVEVVADVIMEPIASNGPFWKHPAKQQAMVEIRMRDYGLGIPPEQAPLLFRRFVRLPRDLTSKVPGNGLGLYLCRVLAEAMGGSMSVESSGIPGEGTTFFLRLPTPPSPLP